MTDWQPPDDIKPFMVCAAIRRTSDGAILAGPRHFDTTMTAVIRGFRNKDIDAELDRSWVGANQGFIDQWGRFYDRTDAALLAFNAGQTDDRLPELYSEDLY